MAFGRFGFVAAFVFTIALAGGCQSSAPQRDDLPPADVKELAKASLAEIDGQLKVDGLKQPVQLVRDEWGVPHIYAQNVDDLFFAQCYVMDQDRLWEMEWWRRELEGRLAEVLGPRRSNAIAWRGC
jgi:acyl-homoserine lactone acylase PvdQ